MLLSKPEVQVRVWYGTGYKPVPDPARRVKPNPAISANAGSGTGFFGTLDRVSPPAGEARIFQTESRLKWANLKLYLTLLLANGQNDSIGLSSGEHEGR